MRTIIGKVPHFLPPVTLAKTLWQRWNTSVHRLGTLQARLLLSIFYFAVLAPFALGVKLFSDPLELKARKGWKQRAAAEEDPSVRARRQF